MQSHYTVSLTHHFAQLAKHFRGEKQQPASQQYSPAWQGSRRAVHHLQWAAWMLLKHLCSMHQTTSSPPVFFSLCVIFFLSQLERQMGKPQSFHPRPECSGKARWPGHTAVHSHGGSTDMSSSREKNGRHKDITVGRLGSPLCSPNTGRGVSGQQEGTPHGSARSASPSAIHAAMATLPRGLAEHH